MSTRTKTPTKAPVTKNENKVSQTEKPVSYHPTLLEPTVVTNYGLPLTGKKVGTKKEITPGIKEVISKC